MDKFEQGITTGYHLFFEPTGKLQEELSTIIKKLASEFGGPVFTPHVTLLAQLPAEDPHVLVEKTKILAGTLAPFSISLGRVETRESYFKAVFVLVEKSEMLQKAHMRASEIFSMKEHVYEPHLSLLYGHYSEESKREAIKTFDVPTGSSIQIDRIHLYKTEGEVRAWEKIGEYEFET